MIRKFIFLALGFTWLSANAEYINPYHLFSRDFSVVAPGSEIVVTNMPPVRSQDGMGLCFAFADAAIIEHRLCKINQWNCQTLKDDQRVSVIDLAKYAFNVDPFGDDRESESYQRLDSTSGGSPSDVLLIAISRTKVVAKETCAPFDAAVSRLGDQPKQQEAVWKALEQQYAQAKSDPKACIPCLADKIAVTFNVPKDRIDVAKALSAGSYQEFLYQLLIPKVCEEKTNKLRLKNLGRIGRFPLKEEFPDTTKISYEGYLNQIKLLLAKQIAVSTGVCFYRLQQPNSVGHCTEGGHQVVITGYRKICKKNGECYDSLKIHNSYGQSWQDKNDDGWVVAKDFIDHIPRDEHDTLIWLE